MANNLKQTRFHPFFAARGKFLPWNSTPKGGCRLQRSSKSQAPNQGPSDVVAIQGGPLRFGAWNFSGVGAWDLKLPRRVIPSKTARNRKISRLLIVIHDRYRVSECVDNRQSSSYFKANLLGPFVRRASCVRAHDRRAVHILNDVRDGKLFCRDGDTQDRPMFCAAGPNAYREFGDGLGLIARRFVC